MSTNAKTQPAPVVPAPPQTPLEQPRWVAQTDPKQSRSAPRSRPGFTKPLPATRFSAFPQWLKIVLLLVVVVIIVLAVIGLTGCSGGNSGDSDSDVADSSDIDGHEIASPVAGTDGYDENGDSATAVGEADKDALVQSLLPPESEISQATSEAVYIDSLTDYADALNWYEENLPKLGFESTLSEEDQELLNMSDESRLYIGTIGGQPISVMVQDWSNTVGNGDMSKIMISFTGY
jgi:hypothetical protein